jgi:magnesium-transporting ATPase (P-type)
MGFNKHEMEIVDRYLKQQGIREPKLEIPDSAWALPSVDGLRTSIGMWWFTLVVVVAMIEFGIIMDIVMLGRSSIVEFVQKFAVKPESWSIDWFIFSRILIVIGIWFVGLCILKAVGDHNGLELKEPSNTEKDKDGKPIKIPTNWALAIFFWPFMIVYFAVTLPYWVTRFMLWLDIFGSRERERIIYRFTDK